MNWEYNIVGGLKWSAPISNLEAKQEVAREVASKVSDGDLIGFGSGSTSFLAIQAIAATLKDRRISCAAIPTSLEGSFACSALGIPTVSLRDNKPNWAFDGADEVDPQNNLIKGRGGAMFREKLILDSSPKTFILVDRSKLVPELGRKFPIPIEVFPFAVNFVATMLYRLGAAALEVRLGLKKDGPVITENGNLIVDARFPAIGPGLELDIKKISGVIDSGLFIGRHLDVLVAGK